MSESNTSEIRLSGKSQKLENGGKVFVAIKEGEYYLKFTTADKNETWVRLSNEAMEAVISLYKELHSPMIWELVIKDKMIESV